MMMMMFDLPLKILDVYIQKSDDNNGNSGEAKAREATIEPKGGRQRFSKNLPGVVCTGRTILVTWMMMVEVFWMMVGVFKITVFSFLG